MKSLNIFIISIVLIFFSACEKNGNNCPKGDMIGFVELLDGSGNEIVDKSGVKVSLENTSYSAITDKNGRYEFRDIQAGTYFITYTKEGFGTYKRYNCQFVGGRIPDLVNETILYEFSSVEILNIEMNVEGDRIIISGEITESRLFSLQSFINDSADVSNTHYDYTSDRFSYYSSIFPYSSFNFSYDLNFITYQSGDEIFIVLYSSNGKDSGYYDYETGMHIYPTLTKTSEILSFTLE